MKLILRDRNQGMVDAWKVQFRGVPDVEIGRGDIFDIPADAIVSPANSGGWMNGGIDLAYSQKFGWQLQERLQKYLVRFLDGELPVGNALVMTVDEAGTDEFGYRFMISAPTMRVPTDINGTVNAYLAMRAILREVRKHNHRAAESGDLPPMNSVLCPGLGTAIGRMPYDIAAFQMREAYRVVTENQPLDFHDIAGLYCHHDAMRRGLPYREPESVFGVKDKAGSSS